ncbi:UDP-N-acetylglucosamine 2-epimerase (non-hydrolysing) [Pseudomonas asturiensis]|uniref:UDP-N-acetylglucosamine 2-epimerase (Non-hydrolysing) n=1 Tax=Pseudomonas asturiensis TaxID=1190415 RepID=A0A1M7JUJ3_9PSED|nr:UDP-N-acetylglucosamine 2-epimerase (non-hydrolyzing) [Pseudomonas asturiensis]SHM56709.1 UDP-N-acetylglucosamine 2-epimerase (non-hydrolysing) [Pseudomonas asturiensis]
MHIAFVLGTRPEIIKLSSLIIACIREGVRYTLIHTNQHYAAVMDRLFFEELGLPLAHFNLGVGSDHAGSQLARMIMGVEPVLREVKPDYVIVQGDTNSALAGGLAASKAGIPVGHVEAGLRSFDKTMPEETNRVLLDHLSSFWFCPSSLQVGLLAEEGIESANVVVTGNTGIDATLQHAQSAARHSVIRERLGLEADNYLLLTCHRPSNTDHSERFSQIMLGVQHLAEIQQRKVVFPVHPRLGQHHHDVLRAQTHIHTIEPVGYLDMLALLQGAALVLTDSGGLQEEACVLQRRCLILRSNTERPESLETGGARLAGSLTSTSLVEEAQALGRNHVSWKNPFGDGHAHRRILDTLKSGLNPGLASATRYMAGSDLDRTA